MTARATGLDLIALERARQVDVEGFTPGHDAEHEDDALALAAACYATPPDLRDTDGPRLDSPPMLWPFAPHWWKPGERVRDLVRAGALIAAEVDRLLAADLCLVCLGTEEPPRVERTLDAVADRDSVGHAAIVLDGEDVTAACRVATPGAPGWVELYAQRDDRRFVCGLCKAAAVTRYQHGTVAVVDDPGQ